MKQKISVKGMHCKSCSMLIQEALEDEGAKNVNVSLDEKKQIGTISLDTTMNLSQITKIIQEQGDYTVL